MTIDLNAHQIGVIIRLIIKEDCGVVAAPSVRIVVTLVI
jgi:hypothetical protein